MLVHSTNTFIIDFYLEKVHYTGNFTAELGANKVAGYPDRFIIYLNHIGVFHLECTPDGCWRADTGENVAHDVVDFVGDYIQSSYN